MAPFHQHSSFSDVDECAVVANIIARCKSDVVRFNKDVNETTTVVARIYISKLNREILTPNAPITLCLRGS